MMGIQATPARLFYDSPRRSGCLNAPSTTEGHQSPSLDAPGVAEASPNLRRFNGIRKERPSRDYLSNRLNRPEGDIQGSPYEPAGKREKAELRLDV
jgi:hypothetical protein